MTKAVCFDLDDTLGHYAADFGAFTALVRNELGLHQCDTNAFAKLVSSELRKDGPLTFELALRRVLDGLEQRPPADLAQLAATAMAWYAADYRALPGAAELLADLDARGVKLVLVTNGPDDMQRAALRALGFERHFRAVLVSGDRDVAARKPAPRIFSLALTALEVVPEEAVMIGDDLDADIGGAIDYGLEAIHVGTPTAPVPAGVGQAADLAAVRRQLAELLGLGELLGG
ncbi:MAG TPA: HAD family hydrolase [Trueperaceae bacterium]|nr:HAD family hydrolase [Trueperaceae bacterium]